MNSHTNQVIKLISEAYEGIISEGKEAKFKVGDKVGIGSYSSYAGHYHPVDTGTVTKVNAHGHHTVTYDNRKSMDNPDQQYTDVFDHAGNSRNKYSSHSLIPLETHENFIKSYKDKAERSRDFEQMLGHINGHRTGAGHYVPFDSETARQLKELIDKHTAKE